MTKVSFYTITPAKLARIAPYLTLSAALAHNATTDKWLYVVDNILDPAEVVTTPALVEYIETVLECMVAQNTHKA